MKIEAGMRLRSKTSNRVGTVMEVNIKWNWFKFKWDYTARGDKTISDLGIVEECFTKERTITKDIERADRFLKRANGGLDDNWRDYD